jgi:hypothetical protein
MKSVFQLILILAVVLVFTACRGRGGSSAGSEVPADNTSAQDTGFTGVKKYTSGAHVAMAVTFKNGVKEGLSTTYYASGKVKGTSLFVNGLRQDSSKWFFEEGQLFRATPFKNDTVDGTQIQYYRNGKVKARIGYKKGLRTFDFEEFDLNGKRYTGYPELIISTKDNYNTAGTFTISLKTSDKQAKVKYFRGNFSNGLFDSTRCEKIRIIGGEGILELKKSGTSKPVSVDLLASILSPYGNSYLVHKSVTLPYNDLK